MWISKVTFPRPEDEDIRSTLVGVVDALKLDDEKYTVPEIKPVEAEWTGYRTNVHSSRPRLDLSEQQHYERLMKEVTSDVTTLYFHGGAYYLMDPASHRVPTSNLARLTGGRCLSVRYRLAPQNPFPAALLDALVAYMSLLSPPPGSFHAAVPASHIVFGGDSAGGGLSMSLLQLLLHLHRSSSTTPPRIRFHGRDVEIPLPAGVAVNSAWLDILRCMPSVYTNAIYDYLPAPPSGNLLDYFPECDLWPTDPPRGDLYCDVSMLCHPLVSPLAANNWRGSCPLWILYGSECLTDEGKAVAQLAAAQGVPVVWKEFEAMPHCFGMIFPDSRAGKRCMEDWASFMREAVEGKEIVTDGKWIEAKTLRARAVDVERLSAMEHEDVLTRMRESQEKRRKGIEGNAKLLPKL